MMLELSIAIVAVLVSVISFEVNRRASSAAERHGRMPVLIPQPMGTKQEVTEIRIRNIGRGPALNIVIAAATGDLASEDISDIRLSRRRHGRQWDQYMHLQPIEPGTERCYLLHYRGAVGLAYTDALGKSYTLLSSPYGTKVVDGNVMIHPPLNALQYPQRCD